MISKGSFHLSDPVCLPGILLDIPVPAYPFALFPVRPIDSKASDDLLDSRRTSAVAREGFDHE
jgi:hypothetical protein